MDRVFASVYLDEDVSVLVGDLLRARGFQATVTREAHQLGSTDVQQLDYAARNGMVLLTHNRADFEALHRHRIAQGRPHAGILVAARRRPHEILGRLLRLLNDLTADEFENQLLYL